MASPRSSVTLSLSLFAVCTILAKPLQALSPSSSSSSSSTLSQLLPILNSTTLSTLNASSTSENAALTIHCSGDHFGFHPNIADCESAKEYISPDSVQYTWGARHSGLERTVFPLPYRIMGGQSTMGLFSFPSPRITPQKVAKQVGRLTSKAAFD